MPRPRDSQRSRVYAAENSVFQFGQTIPDDLLQAFLNDILDKRAVRSRFGPRRVSVERGRSGARAYGSYRITMGVQARNEWLMCHELAHCLTPGMFAAHGPEFCGVYLFLLEIVISKDAADRLKAAFAEGGVKWNNKAIPKPSDGSRIPPRQYPRFADVRAEYEARQPSAEVAAARSLAAKKAWETRKAKEQEQQRSFPMQFKMSPRLAGEMNYQREVDGENAEDEGVGEPSWWVRGRVLIVDDMEGLDRAQYRAACAADWDEMRSVALKLFMRLKDAADAMKQQA